MKTKNLLRSRSRSVIGKKIGKMVKASGLLLLSIMLTGCVPGLMEVVQVASIGTSAAVAAVPVAATVEEFEQRRDALRIDLDGQRVNAIPRPIKEVVISTPNDNLGQAALVSGLLRDQFEHAGMPIQLAFSSGNNIAAATPAYHTVAWSSGKLDQVRKGLATITTGYFEMSIADGQTIVWRQRYDVWIKNVPTKEVYVAATNRAAQDFFTDCGQMCRKIAPSKVALR